ncbi:MAG: hypothetical protein A2Z50_00220 [Nitrospirae bacterium RBG_19FT_COMBO_42_15]|nr:MAG: hypothetical protein A2Z50_00220 [Nitrospirae bacterium RBG_19FT_COMBO_42_15]
MNVTEQIDAIKALGANPVKKLVVPRVAAAIIVLPMLTLFADIIGITGGMIISQIEFGISPYAYYDSVIKFLKMSDIFSGIGKSVFFGFIIAIVGCYQGMITSGGTEGVGLSTTVTVVTVSIVILISDFFLTKFLKMSDIFSGIGKSLFFGFVIAIVGCYQGMITSGGTEGVGLSTTVTVVTVSIVILISDFFLTKFFWLF